MALQLTPDPLGHDDVVLTRSEALDEDDMGVDPLEDGMDPAEDWSAANRYGTTAIEQATDRPLTEQLKEERPDVGNETDTTAEPATRRGGHPGTEPPGTDPNSPLPPGPHPRGGYEPARQVRRAP